MIVEALGVKDAEAAKDALDAILANNGKTATITADADTTTAEQKIADLSSQTTTVPLDGDTSQAKQKIESLNQSQITVPVDADTTEAAGKIRELEAPIRVQVDATQVQQALASMQAEIVNSFTGGAGGDGGLGGSGGQGGQGGQGGTAEADINSVFNLLSGWSELIQTIRDRLPVTALAA
jgi:hypothetical protein